MMPPVIAARLLLTVELIRVSEPPTYAPPPLDTLACTEDARLCAIVLCVADRLPVVNTAAERSFLGRRAVSGDRAVARRNTGRVDAAADRLELRAGQAVVHGVGYVARYIAI